MADRINNDPNQFLEPEARASAFSVDVTTLQQDKYPNLEVEVGSVMSALGGVDSDLARELAKKKTVMQVMVQGDDGVESFLSEVEIVAQKHNGLARDRYFSPGRPFREAFEEDDPERMETPDKLTKQLGVLNVDFLRNQKQEQ